MSISKPKVVVLPFFLVFATLLVAGVSARKLGLFSRTAQTIVPRVTNRTTSVRISTPRRSSNGGIEITLSNQSPNAIYAYTIVTSQRSVEKGMTTFVIDAPLAPGATRVERLAAGNFDSASGGNPGDDEIVMSAVYFEGGTVEGESRHSDKLRQTMAGMKEQAKLALHILSDAAASSEQDSDRLLERAESQAASMPVSDISDAAGRAREIGKTNINARLTKEVKQLRTAKEKSVTEVKARLTELISHYQLLADKL